MAYDIELKKQFQANLPKGKRWKKNTSVLFICVAISIAFWIITTLSKDYETSISIPLKFINIPQNSTPVGYIPDKLFLKVKTQGFTILKHKYFPLFNTFSIDLDEFQKKITFNKIEYSIYTKDLYKSVTKNLGNDISIEDIWPEMINLKIEKVASKKVPVIIDYNITCDKKYSQVFNVSSYPDSIEIYAPHSVLDTLKSVKSERIVLENINESVVLNTKLTQFSEESGVIFNQNMVKIFVDVNKFTESEIEVPVTVENIPPEYKVKLFPEKIRVIYNVNIKDYDKIDENLFHFIVDFQSLSGFSKYIVPILKNQPDIVNIRRVVPEKIEYIVEE